jgi:hypothetical protein
MITFQQINTYQPKQKKRVKLKNKNNFFFIGNSQYAFLVNSALTFWSSLLAFHLVSQKRAPLVGAGNTIIRF